jgi:hypothetical protein
MPLATAASTNCCAAGSIGSRTETPSGPVVLCAPSSNDGRARHQPLAHLEVREDLAIAPAGSAGFGPGIEVAGIAAHVHHVIDARRAAEHLAARHRHAAAVEPEPGAAGIRVNIQSGAGLSCINGGAIGRAETAGGRSPASIGATRQFGSSERWVRFQNGSGITTWFIQRTGGESRRSRREPSSLSLANCWSRSGAMRRRASSHPAPG